MQKVFFMLFICIGLNLKPRAQKTADSLSSISPHLDSANAKKGLGYFRYGVSFLVPFNQQGNPIILPALTLAPGLRIIQSKDFILSLSFPISLMGTFKYDYLLGIDLPVMLDLNIGAAAANDQKSAFGFIIGAGVAYIDAVNNYNNEEGVYRRADFWGCRLQFGIDIGKEGEGSDRDILFMSYGRSFTNGRLWVIGISVQIMMGKP